MMAVTATFLLMMAATRTFFMVMMMMRMFMGRTRTMVAMRHKTSLVKRSLTLPMTNPGLKKKMIKELIAGP